MTRFRSLFIFFFVMCSLAAVLVGILPFILESSLRASAQLLSTPHADNTNIWALFPGKLKTSLTHSFSFFTFDTEKSKVILSNAKKVLDETITYDDFVFNGKTDEITFKSNRKYEVQSETDDKITTVQQGMFELFETITNIPLYQKGIIGMNYLLQKVFGTPEDFLLKLYLLEVFDSMMYDAERLKETLLQSLDAEKQEKILNDPTYGILKQTGLKYWIDILGNDQRISEAKWLTIVLGLNDKEIALLVGKQSYLNLYFKIFNDKIVTTNKCPTNPCGYEIIYRQMIDQSITKALGVDNVKELNDLTDPSNYPFDSTLEMSYYYSTLTDKTIPYETIQISQLQLELFLGAKSSKILLDPINAINLLNYNATTDLYSSYTDFIINSHEQLIFIANYFFDFLPKTFLFGKITNGEQTMNIEPLAKGYLSLIQTIVDKSYGRLIDNEYMYSLLLAKMVHVKLDPALVEETCPILLQKIIGDGQKVMKICNMDEFSMKSVNSLYAWMQGFICITDTCDEALLNHIKEVTELSTKQLTDIYSEESLGKYIIPSANEAKDHYQCDTKCSSVEMGKRQFLKNEITQNPPPSISDQKADSVYDWAKEDFEAIIEIGYYQQLTNCPIEDCNDKSNEAVISLYGLSKNLFGNNLSNKINFEKMFTLLMEDIKESTYGKSISINNSANFFKVFTAYTTNLLFKNQYLKDYSPNSLLYGNDKEDKETLELLRNGNPYENYKPKIPKTTGFNLGIESSMNTDSYTILTSQNDKTQILRRIFKTNNVPLISISKMEYSSLTDSMIPIQASLYNFFKINNEQWISDGYQYDANMDTLYYYDELSCRILQFDYNQRKSVGDIHCNEYVLNKNISQSIMEKEDITLENFGQASQRFNKPYVISMPNSTFTKGIDEEILQAPSFICVDPFSNMVIESNLTLVYSMYTKNYMYLNEAIPKNEIIPLFLYERNYKMSQETYNEIFKGIISYFSWRLILIISGCGVIAGLLALALYYTFRHCKEAPEVDASTRENLLVTPEFA